MSLLCKIMNHRVARDRVWDDGLNLRSRCRQCGQPMLRDFHGWRLFDSATDSDVRRAAHPHSHLAA